MVGLCAMMGVRSRLVMNWELARSEMIGAKVCHQGLLARDKIIIETAYPLFRKAENAITGSQEQLHGVDETLVLSILFKTDRGMGYVVRGESWHGGSCIIVG